MNSAVTNDKELFAVGETLFAAFGDALAGKFSRITALSEINVADIVIQVIDTERSDFPQLFDQPVVVIDMAWLPFQSILGTSVLKVAEILFLLAIY